MPKDLDSFSPEAEKSSGFLKLLIGAAVGFSFFSAASTDSSPINKKFPDKKIKNISYFPRVKISGNRKYYHIHHWIIFSVVYLPFLLKRGANKSRFLHGIFLGSIIQGLMFQDRFQIKYNSSGKN